MEKSAVEKLLGKIPEVPFTVTVDDRSIIRISIAAVIVVTICMLLAAVLKHHTK
jgi:hypothetical protein